MYGNNYNNNTRTIFTVLSYSAVISVETTHEWDHLVDLATPVWMKQFEDDIELRADQLWYLLVVRTKWATLTLRCFQKKMMMSSVAKPCVRVMWQKRNCHFSMCLPIPFHLHLSSRADHLQLCKTWCVSSCCLEQIMLCLFCIQF